jgi:hypothetical protein
MEIMTFLKNWLQDILEPTRNIKHFNESGD